MPSLESLPNDAHYELSKYLSALELINLSHTSNTLQYTYRPLSFRRCFVVDNDPQEAFRSGHGQLPWHLENRPVPLKAFLYPQRYSWYYNGDVLRIAFDPSVLTSLALKNSLYGSALSKTQYPELMALEIAGRASHAQDMSASPDGISFQIMKEMKGSLFYASLSQPEAGLEPSTIILTVSSHIVVRQADQLLQNLHYFKDIKNISLTLGWHPVDAVPRTLVLGQAERLALRCVDTRFFSFLIDQLAGWPRLRVVHTTHFVSWARSTIKVEENIRHLQRLPTTLEHVVVNLDPIEVLPAETQRRCPTVEIDRSAQLPRSQIFNIPQVREIVMKEAIGTKGEGHHNPIEFPGLKVLQLTIGVPWNRMMNRACTIHNLTTLYLRTEDGYAVDQECLFWLIEDFGEFRSLRRLALSLKSADDDDSLEMFAPYFRQLRSHYKTSNAPPERAWLNRAVRDAVDWAARPGMSAARVGWLKALMACFALKPQRAAVMLLRMFANCRELPGMLNIGLIEALVEKIMELDKLEYLAIDFSGPGVLSPGIYRLLRFHKSLKQLLVLEHVKPAGADGSFSSAVFDSSLQDLLVAVYDATPEDSTGQRVLGAQILVDVARKRKFLSDETGTLLTALPIPCTSQTNAQMSNNSHLFVPANDFGKVFIKQGDTREHSFDGWI